ncbi:hypothetical protein HanIR_Chr06g0260001 [Helianthus annuus]|nr:hypothetical protein HanIR_Chr06g0260001 [Helianthus annuus]
MILFACLKYLHSSDFASLFMLRGTRRWSSKPAQTGKISMLVIMHKQVPMIMVDTLS